MLDLGEMRPTTISLQLANHSVKYPVGILVDVPIKIGDLYVPIDFIILQMEEDMHTHIILGRPFLASTECHTDVKNGNLPFDVDDEHVEFNLIKASKFPSISGTRIDVMDTLVQKTISNNDSHDPLKHCLLNDGSTQDESPKVAMYAQFLEASPLVSPTLAMMESLAHEEASLKMRNVSLR